jgi:hypothetical protein
MMNQENLGFFYNKKSPIFLVEIVTFIGCIIIRNYPTESPEFNRFTMTILIGVAIEIIVKTLGLMLWKKFCSERPSL